MPVLAFYEVLEWLHLFSDSAYSFILGNAGSIPRTGWVESAGGEECAHFPDLYRIPCRHSHYLANAGQWDAGKDRYVLIAHCITGTVFCQQPNACRAVVVKKPPG